MVSSLWQFCGMPRLRYDADLHAEGAEYAVQRVQGWVGLILFQLTQRAQRQLAHLGEPGLLQAGDFLAQPADGLPNGDIAGSQLRPYFRQGAVTLCNLHSDEPPAGETLRQVA